MVMPTCHDHHHAMVIAILMMMVRRPKISSSSVPGALEGPFCAVGRAERGYVNEVLTGAPEARFVWSFALGAEVALIMSAK
eukprot:5372195-Alexandrium_andersonii.AAC.1